MLLVGSVCECLTWDPPGAVRRSPAAGFRRGVSAGELEHGIRVRKPPAAMS